MFCNRPADWEGLYPVMSLSYILKTGGSIWKACRIYSNCILSQILPFTWIVSRNVSQPQYLTRLNSSSGFLWYVQSMKFFI